MPELSILRGSASGSSFTLRGGNKLRRFLFRVQQELTPEKIARVAAQVLRRRVIPQLRSVAPRRTGSLIRSLKIVQRGSRVELRGNFYGRFVRTRDGQSLARLAMQLIEESRSEIRAEIQALLRSLI